MIDSIVMPQPTDQPMRERLTPYRCAGCNERFTDLNLSLPTEQITRCSKCKTVNVLRIIVVYVSDRDRLAS